MEHGWSAQPKLTRRTRVRIRRVWQPTALALIVWSVVWLASAQVQQILGALDFNGMASPGVSIANHGRIYFDTTLDVFRVSENAGAYVNLVGTNYLSFLTANSGTDTNTAATTVDTVAISGLTAKDILIVEYEFEQVTQNATSYPILLNTTDTVTLVNLNAATAIIAGDQTTGVVRVQQSQAGATSVNSMAIGNEFASTVRTSGIKATVTTAWTGSWTLGLRTGGQTAGGTTRWKWSVYRLAGQ